MLLDRREFLRSTLLLATAPGLASLSPGHADTSSPWRFEPEKPLIPAPSEPELWPEFRRQLAEWRELKRQELAYSDALYRQLEFAWAASSFCCCFLMLYDETFYDLTSGRYQAKAFVERGRKEFGGYDSVVLWHAYPRIGLDARNQFDFYRDMPGGLTGLRRMTRQLHRAGLKVYIDYNPWDTNTRREPQEDVDALADLVGELGADGIFLDTMDKGAESFRAKLDKVRPGVVLESEIALPLDRVHDHHLSWAQWFGDSPVPGVLRNKWFERRHLQHQIDRWSRDHTAELQQAWMNGSGMMVWENVFGAWVGWNPRDKSLLRSMLPVQRRYRSLFCGEAWTPLVTTLQPGVYASLWEGAGLRLWTLVNRTNHPIKGELLTAPVRPSDRAFDLISGTEVLMPATGPHIVLRGEIPERGVGGFVMGPQAALGKDFSSFLASQRQIHQQYHPDTSFPAIQAAICRPSQSAPEGRNSITMALIPGVSAHLKVQFRARECGYYDSTHPADHHHRWSGSHAPVWFERPVTLSPYSIDLNLVTNAQYATFLKASGYRPRHQHNFLKLWRNGRPPAGKEDHPVVYVDLEDARAYARWAGKRLPTEEEWQYAAQGADGRQFPWGNTFEAGRCNDGSTGDTTPVGAFPAGRSPFGLLDACGNVWQWTESERSDGRTRFAILRGGSFYRRGGSDWYFDEGLKPVWFAAKMLLLWPGLDRCANIGFRCALDLA
jgi:formylglycine-generating enzyme required for sulfatase activity